VHFREDAVKKSEISRMVIIVQDINNILKKHRPYEGHEGT